MTTDDPKMNAPNDPLQGFEVSEYDPNTETLTIKIHSGILKNPRQEAALAEKFVEIIKRWPGISTVQATPRK